MISKKLGNMATLNTSQNQVYKYLILNSGPWGDAEGNKGFLSFTLIFLKS